MKKFKKIKLVFMAFAIGSGLQLTVLPISSAFLTKSQTDKGILL